MEDLKAIFNSGLVLALMGIGGWLCLMLLVGLFRVLLKGVGGFYRLNERLTRENPYIAEHNRILIDREHYNDYLNVARRDGYPVTEEEQEETEEPVAKKKKKKK